VRYDWDETKNLLNQRKYGGVSFELAALSRLSRARLGCCWWYMRIGRTIMAKRLSESSRPARLKTMRSEDIKNRQWTEAERKAVRRIAERQAAGKRSRVSAEIPRLTDEQLASLIRLRDARKPKVAVSVRLDAQVLDWLKSKGEGHLTRINDILMWLMEAEHGTRS
jgi:uncharacterized protein (DUF4415 family)